MARTRVVLRRNGSKVGEVTYASESEAVAHAAKMQGAASGLEALLAPTGAKPNRKPRRRNPPTNRSLVGQVVGIVKKANVPYAAKGQAGNAVSVRGLGSGGVMVVSHAPNAVALVEAVERAAVAAGWSVSFRHAGGAGASIVLQSPLVPNPSIGRGPRRNGFRAAIGAAMTAYRGVGQAAREAQSATVEAARAGIADAKAAPGRALQSAKDAVKRKMDAITEKAQAAKREIEHQRVRQGVNAAIDTIEEYGYVVALKPLTLPTQKSTRLNPGVRTNPTPIDVASLDFAGFKRTTVIKGYYNVRTGRRFARVASRDGTFITDVPVKDGTPGESGTRGADAIKKRAYEQLRIHIQPTKWTPSVRVNPGNAGSVRYGGAAIRIADGTYTVQPHGPAFNGPDGFVAAKKWIDTHGA